MAFEIAFRTKVQRFTGTIMRGCPYPLPAVIPFNNDGVAIFTAAARNVMTFRIFVARVGAIVYADICFKRAYQSADGAFFYD